MPPEDVLAVDPGDARLPDAELVRRQVAGDRATRWRRPSCAVPLATVKSRCARGRARLVPLLADLQPTAGRR